MAPGPGSLPPLPPGTPAHGQVEVPPLDVIKPSEAVRQDHRLKSAKQAAHLSTG